MSAQERLARGKSGGKTTIRWDSDHPHVEMDSHTIHLPPLPETVGEVDEMLLRAYVDHETAHVLFTSPAACRGLSKAQLRIFNAIEDARVEILMGQAYYGCRVNLERCSEHLLSEFRGMHRAAGPPSAGAPLFSLATLALGEMARGFSAPEAIKRVGGGDEVVALLDLVKPTTDRLSGLAHSDDARSCAVEIYRRWHQHFSDRVKKQLDSLPDDRRDKLPGLEELTSKILDRALGGPSAHPDLGERLSRRIAQRLGGVLTAKGLTTEGDSPASSRPTLRPAASKSGGSYIAWTADDQEVEVEAQFNDQTAPLRQEARAKTSFLRTALLRDLTGRGPTWTSNRKRGKLDPGRLHRVGVRDGRIFRRRRPADTVSTAITLLIDFSGSMCLRGKIDLALQLGFAFAEACEQLGVPNEVLGFTTNLTRYSGPEEPGRLSRVGPLRHLVIKPFRAPLAARQHAFANAKSRMEGNIDGESLLWAARRLAQRSERERTLIVLSDGCPAGYGGYDEDLIVLWRHMLQAVSQVERAGIQCIGIGIKSEAVSRFYSNHVVFRCLDDLVAGGYSKLAKLLRGARRPAA